MRYMMIMHVEPETAASAGQEQDIEQVIAQMGAYNEQLQNAGVFLAAEGLTDADEGFRVDFTTEVPTVTDGPFAEAREVFNGYWILEVTSREEVELWATRCPLGPGAALEVRRIGELDDWDIDGNEWLEKEKEWRAANS